MSANDSIVEVEISPIKIAKRIYKNGIANEVNRKIIEAVEVHPCLYNIKDRDYGNPMKMGRAWSSIAREVLESEDFVKKRWQQLKQRYIKYRRCKFEHKQVTSFKLATQLSFMDPHITTAEKRDEGYEAMARDDHVKNAEFYKEEDTVDMDAMINVADGDAMVDADNFFVNIEDNQQIDNESNTLSSRSNVVYGLQAANSNQRNTQEFIAGQCLSKSDTVFVNYIYATLVELPSNRRNELKSELSSTLHKYMNSLK